MLLTTLLGGVASAEVDKVVFGFQNGWMYAPIMVMNYKGLVEKHAKNMGVNLKAEYINFGSGGVLRDTILAGQTHYGIAGVPVMIQMNDKTNSDIKTVGNTVSAPMYLNTRDIAAKNICDLDKPGTKIALPTIKSSMQAVTLQIAAKKYCGDAFKLDKYTVSLTHPDGMAQILTSTAEINNHFTAPPFQFIELEEGKGTVKRLLSSYDALGGTASSQLFFGSEKFAKQNPKVHDIVVRAYTEAMDFVKNNRVEAAKIYIAVEKPKDTEADIIKQMTDPDVNFDLAPNKIEIYSNFMKETGAISKAYNWKEMSFPNLHNLNGS